MSYIRLICILLSLILLGGCARNSLLDQGIHSFKERDFRRAFILLMPVAKAGNPEAQYAIGYMYYYSEGVVEDRYKAWYWISCAAKAGQPDAILALGLLKPWYDKAMMQP